MGMSRVVMGVGPLLAGMVAKGLVQLEQLDMPTARWQAELSAMTDYRRMAGKSAPEWTNPAREWIEQNPQEWVALQNLHAATREARKAFRQPKANLGWPEAAGDRLLNAVTASTGWTDSDEIVEFEP